MFSRHVSALVLAALCLGRALPAAQGYAHGGSEPELALQLDFVDVAGTQVHDASGQGNDGTLDHARVVTDRKRTAVALDGAGQVTVSNASSPLAAERRSFTIGARCKPAVLALAQD